MAGGVINDVDEYKTAGRKHLSAAMAWATATSRKNFYFAFHNGSFLEIIALDFFEDSSFFLKGT